MSLWSRANDGIVEEVFLDSEKFLAGTVSIAIAADQRASVIASTFTTAAAAIVAGVMAFAAAAGPTSARALSIYFGGLSAALLFFVGAILCMRAAMPVGFHLPGTKPSDWHSDVEGGKTLQECKHDLLRIRENVIRHNLDVINSNARRYKVGAYFGISAPIVGVFFWGIVLLFGTPVRHPSSLQTYVQLYFSH